MFKFKQQNERGVAMLEMAAVTPVLLMLLVISVDLGNAINHYLSMTRITYELSRNAARIPGFNVTASGAEEAEIYDITGNLMQRAGSLMNKYGYSLSSNPACPTLESGAVCYTAYFDTETNQIVVTLFKNHQFLFPGQQFNQSSGITMQTSVSAPYLFPNDDSEVG